MGLGYCGMPHILTRFMAVKSEKELKKSSAIAIVWDILSLTAACFIGIIGRAYLLPTVLGENGASSSESVFIEMINKLFSSHLDFRLSEESSSAVFLRQLCPQRIHSFW